MGIFAVAAGDLWRIRLAIAELGVWRPPPELQEPAIGGHLCDYWVRLPGLPDCLADLGGFELPYYQFEKRL
jgi:hypothetical protein